MKSLYFIAILPAEELRKEVTAFENYMAVNYFSKAALSSPPHITLFPPFHRDEQDEKTMSNSLSTFANRQQSFEISLNGFNCFKPSVIFIKPENNEPLNSLHSRLLLHLKSTVSLQDAQNERPYHPHMTIAARDLKKNFFYEAWEEFREKEFKRTFEVKSLFLLKHNGKYWDVLGEYLFGPKEDKSFG
jgi:2'-5' RNA ligase